MSSSLNSKLLNTAPKLPKSVVALNREKQDLGSILGIVFFLLLLIVVVLVLLVSRARPLALA
jgi:hypothetical protein